MYKNSFVHYLTKIVVDAMFFGGIALCFFVPYFVKWWTGLDYMQGYSVAFYVILFLSAVCVLYILWQLKQMLKTLLGGNPFIRENVSCFRKMAVASLITAAIYIFKMLFYTATIGTAIVIVIFVVATLFCLTLKDVFKQAVYYKEENDGVV